MTLYTISLYTSLAIFGIGLVYKTWNWFHVRIGPDARNFSASTRIAAAFKGIFSALFSRNIIVLLRVYVLDVLFQAWLLKRNFLRWFAHMCIYAGFMLLLLMHGLEQIVSSALFSDYYSTLNPFMFLRNLFGALVFLGIVLVLYRRFFADGPHPKTTRTDYYAIVILAVIMVSGILLEGTKIASYSAYQAMVEEYAGLDETDEAQELKALEAYWVKAFAVVSPNVGDPVDESLLKQGQEIHEMSCADCHSPPAWAFMGYGVAKTVSPIALALDRANVPTLLWYIHFLACFFGLALLPFSKFFHMFATSVNLLTSAAMKDGASNPANIATKQAIELDACTHCGECTTRCSVAVAFEQIPNPNILPSEKLAALKAMASGKKLPAEQLQVLQEGSHICTDCHRCTDVCPVGINLEALWLNMRKDLALLGYPKLEVWARDAMASSYNLTKVSDQVLSVTPPDQAFSRFLEDSVQTSTFAVCFGCESCTNVCPVVANSATPKVDVGLSPHQIMHALALGRKDLALGSKMLWDCVTCYLCQEHCPQAVRVTDVLYELKNLAYKEARTAIKAPAVDT